MKRLLILALLLRGLAFGAEAYHGECRTTTGPISASCTVNVFDSGTLSASAIFSDSGLSTPLTNPFTAGSNGRFTFYAADGQYDVVMSGGTPTLTTVTISDVSLGTGGAHPVDSVFGRTGAVIATTGDYTAAQITNAARIDTNNLFGAFFAQYTGITTPASPPSNAVRIFVDSADNTVKVRKPNGDVISLEQGASVTNGTVTSVDFTAPSIFSVSGNPITTSGTIALSLATQTANTVFAGPTTGSAAAPTFRALVDADVPSLDELTTGLTASRCVRTDGSSLLVSASGDCTSGTVTSVAATVPAELSLSGSPITSTGTLAFTWASGSASRFIATPSGAAGVYSGRAIVAADIPTLDASKIGTGTFADARIAASNVIQHEASLTLSNMGGAVTSSQMPASTIFGDQSNTYTAAGQEFVPSATTAAINMLCAALPSSPQTGDIACDSADSNIFKAWDGSAWNPLFGAFLADPGSNGIVVRTALNTTVARTLTGPAAGITVSNGTGVSGNPTLALANDLAALESLSSTGIAARTTTDTWAQRTLTAPAAGFTITNPAGIAGNPTFVLSDDLAAVEALASNGCAARTATSTWNVRTITAGSTKLTVSNGDCVSGNPTIDFDDSVAHTPTGFWNFSGGSARLPEKTVAGLPAAASSANFVYVVTDGTSASDCTTGSGSTRALCISNGSAWVALGGGGGSSLDVQNSSSSIVNPASALNFGSDFSVTDEGSGVAGVALAGGGSGIASNYRKEFTSATTVVVSQAEHGFSHSRIIVQCYNDSSPRAWIEPNSITINDSTFLVTITFSTAQSGECILAAAGGGFGDPAFGGLYIFSTTTTGPITPGTYTKIAATSYLPYTTNSNFDEPTDGRLRYTGARTRHFRVTACVSLTSDAAVEARLRIAKGGTAYAESQTNIDIQDITNTYAACSQWQTSLANNEYVEAFVTSDSGTPTFTAQALTIQAELIAAVADSDPGPCWAKYTIAETALTTASTTEDETLFTCTQYCKIRGVVVKHSASFTGGTISAMTVSVGTASAPTTYTSAFDIFQATGDTVFQDTDLMKSATMAAAGHSVIARFTSTGDNVVNATAGSVDIWVCSETIQ